MPLTRTGVDPVPELAQRRAEEPVSRLDLFGNTIWLVTRSAAARAVRADTRTFSNAFATLRAGDAADERGLAAPGGLASRAPPAPPRLRRLLPPSFGARR